MFTPASPYSSVSDAPPNGSLDAALPPFLSSNGGLGTTGGGGALKREVDEMLDPIDQFLADVKRNKLDTNYENEDTRARLDELALFVEQTNALLNPNATFTSPAATPTASNPDLEKLLNDMAESIGMEFFDPPQISMAARIRRRTWFSTPRCIPLCRQWLPVRPACCRTRRLLLHPRRSC